jgi:predicted ATPase/class 3 adenylate cyclase
VTASREGQPARTVTMLFTDIEGSTVLLRRLGSRWGETLSAHRSIVRAAVTASGGEEMGTEGDSFFVVFASAHGAVRAAVTAQRELQGHPWPQDQRLRVRMGLHTGEPEQHGNGYIGEDVHLAARIGATSHGGQVVVSETTRGLVGEMDGSMSGVAFRDLGRHRLKDIDGETHLYDVVVPGLASRFPPLRSLGRRAALPTPRTALVGRDVEVEEVVRLVAQGARLLTLTGPGGCGKTRIALAAAAALDDAYPDGVYFVALDGVEDADAMAGVVADALDAPTALSTRERLVLQLADRRVLLVLDNLEQIDGVERVVAVLLDAGPGVTALATSRRPLLLAGEQELPVAPLSLPVSDVDAEVQGSPAVELYVRAVRRVRPSFTLTPDNSADVAALVRQLDGLPLAIELAAANARLLGPAALAARLDLRLGLGVTAGDRPDRHRSLGRTIEWSYDLLGESDQVAFRRLGVFRGPATLDAVAAVVGEPMLLDSVGSLVASSLVQVTADAEPRLQMLETIKRFAVERLAEASETDATRRRHLAWCQEEVTRLADQLRGPSHPVALDGLAAMDADVRSALDWALTPTAEADQAEQVRAGVDLVDEMTRYWYRFASSVVARRWQERALGELDALVHDGPSGSDDEATVTLLHGLSISMLQHADTEAAIAVSERSRAIAQRLGRQDLEARALVDLGIAHQQLCRSQEAIDLFGRAELLARGRGGQVRGARAGEHHAGVLRPRPLRRGDPAWLAVAGEPSRFRRPVGGLRRPDQPPGGVAARRWAGRRPPLVRRLDAGGDGAARLAAGRQPAGDRRRDRGRGRGTGAGGPGGRMRGRPSGGADDAAHARGPPAAGPVPRAGSSRARRGRLRGCAPGWVVVVGGRFARPGDVAAAVRNGLRRSLGRGA